MRTSNASSSKYFPTPLMATKRLNRAIWTNEMHCRFVEVVRHLGPDATPAKILHHVNIIGLTRLQVASHYQNYRKSTSKVNSFVDMEKDVLLHSKRLLDVDNISLSSSMISTCCGNIASSNLPQSGFCAVV